jgi:hypothetical protein
MKLRTILETRTAAPRSDGIYRRVQGSLRIGLFLLSSAALSGCATPALWKNTAARDWRPQPNTPQFLLANTADEQAVIIVFQQSARIGDKSKERTVAWNPHAAPQELRIGSKALRQLTNVCDRVQVMPIFPHDRIPGDATSAPPGYVVQGPPAAQFTVHLDGASPDPFELPLTAQKPRVWVRVAGMPFAVVADAEIVAAVAGALGAQGMGGASF